MPMAKVWWVLALAQIEFEQCLGQMPATALGENDLFSDQLHSLHIAICRLTTLADLISPVAMPRTAPDHHRGFPRWKAG